MTRPSLAVVLLAIALAAVACDLISGASEAPPPLAPPPAVAPPQPVVPAAPAPPEVAPAPPAAEAPPAQAPAFEWTESPAFDRIPDQVVSGMANGNPFQVGAVIFEPGDDAWRMAIHDQTLTSATGLISGGQSASIDLPEQPAEGKSWIRPMEEGGGAFQIAADPSKPLETTAWSPPTAWAVEITQWDAKDYDAKGEMFQDAGRASGKIAVCYEAADGIRRSWIAGTFSNAVVRYMGKPYWLGDSSKASGSSGSKGKAKGSSAAAAAAAAKAGASSQGASAEKEETPSTGVARPVKIKLGGAKRVAIPKKAE